MDANVMVRIQPCLLRLGISMSLRPQSLSSLHTNTCAHKSELRTHARNLLRGSFLFRAVFSGSWTRFARSHPISYTASGS